MRVKSNTCILALKTKRNKILMAGDRQQTMAGFGKQSCPRSKIIKRSGLLLGGSGDGYLCELITESLELPEFDLEKHTPFEYVHDVFFNRVHKVLEARKLFNKESGELIYDTEVCVLIGLSGELFECGISKESGISINAMSCPYAIGCGADYALGALYVATGTDRERATIALEAAAHNSAGCNAEIDILLGD